MIIVRQFKPTDTFSVIKLASDTLPERYNPSLFSYFYEAHPETFIIAELNHKIIGFLVGIPLNNTLKILMIAVSTKNRKQKIGTNLIKQIINEAKNKNIKKIELEVKTDNKTATEFYKNQGFKITNKITKFYQNGENAYTMEKEI